MRSFFILPTLAAAVLFVLAGRVSAEDPGQETLDKAVDAKLAANDILDLGNVIQLCQKALKEGLTGENEKIAKQLMASALFERGSKFAEAVLEAQPADATELRQLLRIRQTAQADLEQAAELEPKDAQARYYLGRLLALPGGDQEKAAKELSEAIKLASKEVELRAKALVARADLPRKPEERKADYDEAIKLAPRNAEMYRSRGYFLLGEEKTEDGLADIDAALRLDPKDSLAHVLRGMGLAVLKKFDDAQASFDKAIELQPRLPAAYLQRARIHLLQERGKEALDDLNKVLTLQEPTPTALILRASAHQLMGKDDEALEDIETVLKAYPNLPEAVRAKAMLQAGAGKIAEAIGGLESLQKAGQNDLNVQLQLGFLYSANKQTQKAIETFTAVLKKEPGNFTALTSRADAYLRLGKHADAVADYFAAHKVKGDSSHVLNNLAWVLATSPDDKVRDGKKAVELATEACKLTEHKEGHILSTLAAGYAESGDFETAIKWSTKAVELGDEDIKEQLEKELESYKAKKPWREKMDETQEKEKEKEDKPASNDK